MTNKEKALALIGTFVSGDLEKAKSLLAPEYKQHNLAFGTGADAFVAAVAGLQQAPVKTTVNNIRAFEDGDHVFLQTVYNFAGAGEQVAFDVFHFNADGDYALACSEGSFGGVPTTYYDLFRVENGFIAEHWDVMETLAAKETWQNQNGKF